MKLTILAGVAMLLPAAAFAQPAFDVKPGLWESSITTQMEGMAAPAMPQIPADKLAQLPPDQRARIEAMMKGGGPGSGRPTVTKVCMTKEQLAKGWAMSQQNAQQNNCTQKVTNLTASKAEIHVECSGQMKSIGDFIVERIDSEHAKGNMLMKMQGDRPMTMKMTMETRFLGSDCGDVKPVDIK